MLAKVRMPIRRIGIFSGSEIAINRKMISMGIERSFFVLDLVCRIRSLHWRPHGMLEVALRLHLIALPDLIILVAISRSKMTSVLQGRVVMTEGQRSKAASD